MPTSFEDFPALQPSPGVKPNFVNPPSLKNAINILGGIFLALAILAVLARMYVRIRITKQWGWDDGRHCTVPDHSKEILTGFAVTCMIATVSIPYLQYPNRS